MSGVEAEALSLGERVTELDGEAMRIEAGADGFRAELAEARGRVASLEREIAAAEARAEALRAEALAEMDAAGVSSVAVCGREYRVKTSAGRVVFDDEADFKRTNNRFVNVVMKETRTSDRRAIAAAIRAGEDVPGARIESTRTLAMRTT